MNVAIVGSSGYIAGYLLKRFEMENTIDRIVRIDQTQNADMFLNLQKPQEFDDTQLEGIDVVVFTAAVSGPDQCAVQFDHCWNINVTGTSHFIRKAMEKQCRVLFFSSDAVFGDDSTRIYDEESSTQAKMPYGQMKKAVEDAFRYEPLFKAIRLSYVVSAKDRFVSYCLKCVENGETADIFHPFYRNCIGVSDVVDAVMWLISHWDEYEPAFLNVAGKELVSRVRIADELNRFLPQPIQYSVSIPPDDFFKNRPRITQMRSLYLQAYRILPEMTFTEKLIKELEGAVI